MSSHYIFTLYYILPTTWNNSLSEYLRDPELSIDTFRRQLKTFLFAQCWRRHSSALETFLPSRSINLLFTLHYIIYITLFQTKQHDRLSQQQLGFLLLRITVTLSFSVQ